MILNLHGGVRFWNKWTCAYAAKGGHLEVLKWLRDPNLPGGPVDWDTMTCACAAKGGQLEVLKWLRDPNCQVVIAIGMNGHVQRQQEMVI